MQSIRHEHPETILCLGAHPDDIEIGCAGTLIKLIAAKQVKQVLWVVMSGGGDRKREAESAAARVLESCPEPQVEIREFRDGYFPAQWESIKSCVHDLANRFSPDLIFTHRKNDAHQDHRVLGELAWNAFRNHLIYEFEIPKYDADLPIPNTYSVISESDVQAKIDILTECFPTQATKPWFDAETFRGLMRIRGLECHSPSRYAEAFVCRKTVF